jgi:hypothetical protein
LYLLLLWYYTFGAVAALEAILGRWGKTTSPLWRMSGEPCRGVPVDGSTDLDGNPKNNPGIKCDCSYNSGTVCHITQLYVYAPILLPWLCSSARTPGARRSAYGNRRPLASGYISSNGNLT